MTVLYTSLISSANYMQSIGNCMRTLCVLSIAIYAKTQSKECCIRNSIYGITKVAMQKSLNISLMETLPFFDH